MVAKGRSRQLKGGTGFQPVIDVAGAPGHSATLIGFLLRRDAAATIRFGYCGEMQQPQFVSATAARRRSHNP